MNKFAGSWIWFSLAIAALVAAVAAKGIAAVLYVFAVILAALGIWVLIRRP